MKKSQFFHSVMMLILFINIPVNSQDYVKYGQIDPKYFTIEKCSTDTAAHAFFIFNEQTCYFNYNQKTVLYDASGNLIQGYDYRNEIHRHYAIKILDDDMAEEWGSYSLTFSPKYDDIGSVKGVTYNMENGKVVKSKLEKSQIIIEEITKTRSRLKVNMPNVKKGSVLELEINIYSDDFYSTGPWQLQFTIPVEKDILVLKRPEYFNYNRIYKGYFSATPKYSELKINVPITIKSGGQTVDNQTISYIEYTEEYLLNNIPAFPVESYLSTMSNYIASLMFEIAYAKFPNSTEQRFNTSWEAVNKQLLDDEMFGRQLNNTGFLRDQVASVKAKAAGGVELANACFEFVRDGIACNNSLGIFCDKGIKDVLKTGKGDVAGINLLLVALLREAGLSAYPVILSTRGNGMVQMVYPSISDFNYVVAMAVVDGKKLLMDASDKYLTINMLDPICLNDKGRIIDKVSTGWVDLTNMDNRYRRDASWEVKMGEDGIAKASMQITDADLAAYKQRDKIRDKGTYDKYMEDFSHPEDGETVKNYAIENLEDITKPLFQKWDMELDKGYNNGDLIIFQPLYTEVTSDNPFKLQKREYPVEFDYPVSETVVVKTVIPEGYKIESVPKNTTIKILNGAAYYDYKVTQEEGALVAQYEFKINRMMFIPTEYTELKEFFRKMIESQSETVVLVKS